MINYLIENGALDPTRKDRAKKEDKSSKESHVKWRIGPGRSISAECPKTHTFGRIMGRISERSKFWHCGSYETIPVDVHADYLAVWGNPKSPASKKDEKYKIEFIGLKT
jgi:hypothetical protein